MIVVKDLVKYYGNHLAVDHLSFTVEKGKILGFLGPNGAGKSTTMNMITGYISATEGTIEINGYDIFDEPEQAKRCIGYLPEQPPVYPEMTVEEYLKFAANLKKVPRADRGAMIEDIMERTKITHVARRLIKHLSKGYRQRVGLAQALIGFPEVIILDEPTVGLDPLQIIEIRELIHDLAQEHTVILSSHILSEVSAMCDSVIIINHGKLVASGTPQELAERLTNRNSLELELRCTAERAEELLRGIDHITDLYCEALEEGVTHVIVSIEENYDVREQIFAVMSKANCPILKMAFIVLSLEDIFLEITKQDNTEDNEDTDVITDKSSENEEEEDEEDAGRI